MSATLYLHCADNSVHTMHTAQDRQALAAWVAGDNHPGGMYGAREGPRRDNLATSILRSTHGRCPTGYFSWAEQRAE